LNTIRRASTARAAFALALCALAPAAASAANYPDKPIQIIVPYSAGGSTDLVFRVLAQSMSKDLGQSIIIINQPGGAGAIGISQVVKAAPDGYTFGAATLSFAANKFYLKTKLPYDPQTDLEAVTMATRSPEVLTVGKNVPAHSVEQLIELSKHKNGGINFASSGVASDGELGAELFASMSGTKITVIPYGSTGAVPAIVSGQVQALFGPIPSSLPFVKSGDLVALGVTSPGDDPSLPHVAPIAKTVRGLELYSFQGLVAPKGTPKEILERVQAAVKKSLSDPNVKATLARMGAEPVGDTPDQFAAFLKGQFALWARVASKFQATVQ
jgi:tripartite-type tricarboxylate transporter receptor subunit TctC